MNRDLLEFCTSFVIVGLAMGVALCVAALPILLMAWAWTDIVGN